MTGHFSSEFYFLIIDAYSKWREAVPMNSANSLNTKKKKKTFIRIFATHGIPEQIVSENGVQFTSNEFHSFCTANNIKHTFYATYHPATNREAERFI